MRSRRTRYALATALATGLAVMAPAPASASVSGSITFHCTAHLPEWASPQAVGTCGGGATPAVASVNLTGVDTWGVPYTVTGVGSLSAVFEYRNACLLNEPPLVGDAQGQVTISGLTAVHGTTLTSATLTADFSWLRVGTTAAISVTNWRIPFGDRDSATGSLGAGSAAFTPIAGPGNTCASGGPMQALVDGEVTALL